MNYTIKKIKINNFQCIKDITIDNIDKSQWIFLLGDNSNGKTALLQALTIGICGIKNAGHLLEGQNSCQIAVTLSLNNRNQTNIIKRIPKENTWSSVDRPDYFCSYGPSRLQIQDINFDQHLMDSDRSLLNQQGNLLNIEDWIRRQKLREKSSTLARIRYKNVIKLFERLLPNVSKIVLEDDQVYYIENGYKATIHQIGSGHKTILSMVGDIIIRLFEMQSKESDPENLSGIVVIDELDLHLHPINQRNLPEILSVLFPNIQFICSTHSPIPLLGAPKNSTFFVVERDSQKSMTTVRDYEIDISNLQPNTLLTSPLFGMESIRSVQNSIFSEFRTENDYREYLNRKKRDESLKQYAEKGIHLPEDIMDIIYD
jgi:predicted ATP-dependent endonuclease of OLD family